MRLWNAPVVSTELSSASITRRLASLGSERWELHYEARQRIAAGEDIIELTIGEPDIATPEALIDIAHQSMRAGRTGYAGGQGEKVLLNALAQKYSNRTGRSISSSQILALPGTQAALTLSMMSMVETGDAVLVPDPYYATYEGVVHTAGAEFVAIPMALENGYQLTVEQLERAMAPNARVLLLNSPHNPTGATLSEHQIAAIGAFCKKHNLWILSDEVYESLIYGKPFASPFDNPDLADMTVAVSSISKSHAAPGFRSGWAVGPDWMIEKIQAIAESILFGNQPFIADMTAHAVLHPGDAATHMKEAYQRRIDLLLAAFEQEDALVPLKPDAGMFMLVDVTATGMDGAEFARALLENGVAVMPGNVFGEQANGLIRISLTVPDEQLQAAAQRIIQSARNQLST